MLPTPRARSGSVTRAQCRRTGLYFVDVEKIIISDCRGFEKAPSRWAQLEDVLCQVAGDQNTQASVRDGFHTCRNDGVPRCRIWWCTFQSSIRRVEWLIIMGVGQFYVPMRNVQAANREDGMSQNRGFQK